MQKFIAFVINYSVELFQALYFEIESFILFYLCVIIIVICLLHNIYILKYEYYNVLSQYFLLKNKLYMHIKS